MKQLRNIVSLSDMDPDLKEWAREEAKRRGVHLYEVINDSLRIAQLVSRIYPDLWQRRCPSATVVKPGGPGGRGEEKVELLPGRPGRGSRATV